MCAWNKMPSGTPVPSDNAAENVPQFKFPPYGEGICYLFVIHYFNKLSVQWYHDLLVINLIINLLNHFITKFFLFYINFKLLTNTLNKMPHAMFILNFSSVKNSWNLLFQGFLQLDLHMKLFYIFLTAGIFLLNTLSMLNIYFVCLSVVMHFC